MKKTTPNNLIKVLVTAMLLYSSGCSQNDSKPAIGEPEHSQQNGLREEMPDLEISSISVHLLHQLLSDSVDVVLLDVRTPEEVSQGKLGQDALHINIFEDNFQQRLEQLDKKATYYVYCKSGGRSSRAQQQMKGMGFEKVINVDGGITAWLDSGFKVQ